MLIVLRWAISAPWGSSFYNWHVILSTYLSVKLNSILNMDLNRTPSKMKLGAIGTLSRKLFWSLGISLKIENFTLDTHDRLSSFTRDSKTNISANASNDWILFSMKVNKLFEFYWLSLNELYINEYRKILNILYIRKNIIWLFMTRYLCILR